MSVVRRKFDMLIVDDERVMIMPIKGIGYELPQEETKCALRFLGYNPDAPQIAAPARVIELAKPLNDALPPLTRRQITVLRALGDSVDQLTVDGIHKITGMNSSTIAGNLYKLEAMRLASRTKHGLSEAHDWQITTTGIDVLAEATKDG